METPAFLLPCLLPRHQIKNLESKNDKSYVDDIKHAMHTFAKELEGRVAKQDINVG